MRQGRGFTFIELIIALAIFCICLAGVIPSFNHLIAYQRINTAGNDFLNSLMYAREQASFHHARAAVAYRQGGWNTGWIVYLDQNQNGLQDDDEPTLTEHGALDSRIKVYTGKTVKSYIGYTALGNSVHANNAFFADSVTFCSTSEGASGFRATISIGGRVRTEAIDSHAPPCNS